jgi:hypothetical protein
MGVMKNFMVITLLLATAGVSFGQESKWKRSIYLREPILTDSASMLMIPVDSEEFLTSKSGDVNYFCANLIFYNFKTDNSFRLFDRSTYILSCRTYRDYTPPRELMSKSVLKNWILYRVKNVDYTKNGKIDSDDPEILYSSNTHGENLKQLTTERENVVSIEVYHEQTFALITLQRDSNKDGKYDKDDKDHYYVKLDLNTLTLGKKIEEK